MNAAPTSKFRRPSFWRPNFRRPILRTAAVAALAFGLSACEIANPYWTAGTVVLLGPQVATGRNTFYWADKVFGRACDSYTAYDLPVRCLNDD